MDLKLLDARADRGRARGDRRGRRRRRRRTGTGSRGATATGASSCCRRSGPRSGASAGSRRARWATPRAGSTCRRPMRTAWRPSTRCSRSRSGRRRCSTSAPTSRAGSPGAEVPEGASPSPCLGLCERAPASLRTIAGPEPREEQIPPASPPLPQAGNGDLKLLRRIAAGADPESPPELRALERARELGPERVIELVKASPLLGRGGAAFPTGVKWEAVARQPARPHYLVCNADESEPGTFKDRVLMEQDPFALVESMASPPSRPAARRAFIYVRAEYPLAHERLQNAIDRSDVGVEIELRIGAGAYVCGEETALFQSIEGYRGEPRNKPPFPVEVGLYGKPTVVNNVETLAQRAAHRARRTTRATRGSSASRATSPGRACTSSSSALRCASCSSSRAASRRRPSCSAARPARSCGPTSSTSRSRSRAPATPARRSARAS